jgi:hypothetical protein
MIRSVGSSVRLWATGTSRSVRRVWRVASGVALTSLGLFWLTALASGRRSVGARDSDDDFFETGVLCLVLGLCLLLSPCVRRPTPWMLGALYVLLHVGIALAYCLIFQPDLMVMAVVAGVSLVVACTPVALVRHAAKDGTPTSGACD